MCSLRHVGKPSGIKQGVHWNTAEWPRGLTGKAFASLCALRLVMVLTLEAYFPCSFFLSSERICGKELA